MAFTQIKGSVMRAWQRYRGDVRGWGAVGDGVTDDTAAFKSALQESGGVALVPYSQTPYVINESISGLYGYHPANFIGTGTVTYKNLTQ